MSNALTHGWYCHAYTRQDDLSDAGLRRNLRIADKLLLFCKHRDPVLNFSAKKTCRDDMQGNGTLCKNDSG